MIISVIGVPCVGKGSIAEGLREELQHNYRTSIITTSDIISKLLTEADKEAMKGGGLFPREDELRSSLLDTIEVHLAFGADIIILDGFPRFDDQVKWLVQTFFQHQLYVVQVMANDFELIKRANARNRDEYDTGDKLLARISRQRSLLAGVDVAINKYNIPYTSVINDHLDRAVAELTTRIKGPLLKAKHGKTN